MDVVSLFDQATEWTGRQVAAAAGSLDAPTPCSDWTVRTLIDHLLDAQATFRAAADGARFGLPSSAPPARVADDPTAQYAHARNATLDAFRRAGFLDGVLDADFGSIPAAQLVAIAFCDQLVHGWDLSVAVDGGRVPAQLGAAAWAVMDGNIGDELRGSGRPFAAAVPVPHDGDPTDRLLGYCGRDPRR